MILDQNLIQILSKGLSLLQSGVSSSFLLLIIFRFQHLKLRIFLASNPNEKSTQYLDLFLSVWILWLSVWLYGWVCDSVHWQRYNIYMLLALYMCGNCQVFSGSAFFPNVHIFFYFFRNYPPTNSIALDGTHCIWIQQ